MELRHQAASGVRWTSLSQAGRQVLQFMTTVVLARILVPADFGVVAMATVLTTFLLVFKDLGTSTAVIRTERLSKSFLSSIFWVNVAFGFCAMVTVALFSPLAASFFHESRVTALLLVLAPTFLLSGLSTVQQAVLERKLAFKILARIEFLAAALGSIGGIGAAILRAGAWSLVYKSIIEISLTTILLWVYSDWKPKFVLRWNDLRGITSFSLNLTLFNITHYFTRNADYLLIGRFLGPQALGFYTLAYRIVLYPLENVNFLVGRVMFPFYSKIRNDIERFRRTYIGVASAIGFVIFPMMFGLEVVSKELVSTFFGSKWEPVALLMCILAPVGLLQPIYTTTGGIYKTSGRTEWMFRVGLVSGSIIVVSFFIGLNWGIVGVATAYAIANIIIFFPGLLIAFRLIHLPLKRFTGVLAQPFLSSFVMMVFLFGLKSVLQPNLSNWLLLLSLVSIGAAAHLGNTWIFNRDLIFRFSEIAGFHGRTTGSYKAQQAEQPSSF